MTMTPRAHVTQALRDAWQHATKTAEDAAGHAQRTAALLAEQQDTAAQWAERRDALRIELDARIDQANQAEQTGEPTGPRIVGPGPDLIASGQRPMRTSPLGGPR